MKTLLKGLILFSFAFLVKSNFAQVEKVRFDRISIKEGLSQSSVNKIIQDKSGFIWIGTQDGLNKYNGYEIEIFYNDPKDTNTISNNYINALLEDSKGYIWIATDYGICKFDPAYETIERYQQKNGISDNTVRAIVELPDGTIWCASMRGDLDYFDEKSNTFKQGDIKLREDINAMVFVDGNLIVATLSGRIFKYNLETKKLTQQDIDPSFKINAVFSLTVDKDKVWLGTDNGAFLLKNNRIVESQYNLSLPGKIVRAVYVQENGNVWIGTNEGLVQINDGAVTVFQHESNNVNSITHNQIQDIFLDRGGVMWIGTNNGLNKFDTEKVMFLHYREIEGKENSLHGINVWSIFETKDKKLWVGTRKGLNVYNKERTKVSFYDNISNSTFFLNNKSVMSIYEDHSGRLYIGTIDGLFYVKRDELGLPIDFEQQSLGGPVENMVYKITEDHQGRLWVGTKNGLSVLNNFRTESHFFTQSEQEHGLQHKTIRDIKVCQNGSIWLGTESGFSKVLYCQNDSIYLKTYKNDVNDQYSLSSNMVISILQLDEDFMWLGTYGGGLDLFNIKQEKFDAITERNGLANNVIYGVLSDKEGNLWLSTNKGLSSYNPNTKRIKNYIENDGLQSDEFNIGASFQSPSGELFFGGIAGFNSFMPENIKINKNPPQIVFTDIKFSNRKAHIGGELKKHIQETEKLDLSYVNNDITFEFAALHYSFPERNEYTYKLVGYDEDWIEAGHKRSAVYTNLDADEYTFLVKARNSDGVESQEVASITLTISPPFWETWWFRFVAVGFVAGIVILVYRIRVKQIEDQKEALELVVKDRTTEVMRQKEELEKQKALIEEEKEKSEKLLLNILPQDTADELKHRGKAAARHYKQATVMFTDFKGFTQISERYRPQDLVQKLDSYFVKYDEIIARHDMEKIKTIGDAYMAAGGVPIRNKSNPIDVVLAGLEIQNYMQELRDNHPDEDVWNVRIGIHTGELIAGVIGIKRFAYDIWGDTVNVANRLETTCEPDKVNVSGETYKHIRGFFDCVKRGKIEAKSKGEIEMYFVKRIKPELSVDGLGKEPNDMFWEYVDLSLYSSINYQKAEKFIIKTLEDGLSPDLHYHNINHMKDVCESVTRIAKGEGIKGEQLFLLRTAALYHDAGFVQQYQANEPLGAQLARETLPKYGYSKEQIDLVEDLIMATRVPQQPKNHLEQIICDADLDYLGRDDFFTIGDGLKKEFMAYGIVKGDKSWDELQIKFLTAHSYFTATAIKTRRAKKLEHLDMVKDRLAKNEYSS